MWHRPKHRRRRLRSQSQSWSLRTRAERRIRLARRLGIAAGAVVLVVSMVAGGGQAGAVSGVESGYWVVAQTAGGQLPAPPNVPAGGMWVSSNTAIALAVSAIRLTLDTGEAPPVIIS